jgi:hypothetical protein
MLVGVGAADKKLRTLADVHRLGFQPLARVAMDRERSSAA